MVKHSAPAHWEADVALRDGRPVRLRPIRADDAERLATFHQALSDETVYFRFFTPYPTLTARDIARFTQVDHSDRVAFVATIGAELVGVGRYDRINPTEAEVAFVVRDDHQGRGLGSVLLEHLAAAARERGVQRFVAEVLPQNRRMLATFREAGYTTNAHIEDGVVMLSFDIEPTEASIAVRVAREHRAEARSVASVVAPSSIVVVGAGRDQGSVGHELLQHLIDGGFTGKISAVNRSAAADGVRILDVDTYASVREIPQTPTLALLSVPADQVPDVVDDSAAAHVAGLLIISSGFAEAGADGVERQRALVRQARGNGMRVVGPNALGIVNTDPAISMNASLAPRLPTRGPIGFFCQSGALGGAILARAARRRLGVSTFVSAGNRADISGNDMLQYWEDDPATDVVLLYLESVGNPRKFTRIARRLSRTKPVVAMRTGRSTQAYPLGHTVRRTTLPVAAIDSMFAQSGVIETDTVGELFDVAGLLAYQPLPRGRKLAIVSNSVALTVLAKDACDTADLELASEPLNLRHDCSAEELAQALEFAINDSATDSVLVAHVPILGGGGRAWEQAIANAAQAASKPVVAVLVAADEESGLLPPTVSALGPSSVPFFGAVEDALRALRRVTRYAEWRARPLGQVPDLEVSSADAHVIVDRVLGDNEAPVELVALRDDPLTSLLAAYGITVWPSIQALTADEAVAAADQLGYPVALKTLDPRFTSRTDLGGLRLNIENGDEIRTSFASMVGMLDPQAARQIAVQRMAAPGVACVVGSVEDPLFGPVVSFGLAGIVPELLGDRGYRIPPLTDIEAHELVDAPGAAPILAGHGGTPPVDRLALEDLLIRIGLLADDVPELADLRLDPVIVAGQGLAVLGARAVLRLPTGRVDPDVRRL